MQRGLSKAFHYIVLIVDGAAIAAALMAAYALRVTGWPVPLAHGQPPLAPYAQALPVVMAVVMICFHYAGMYLQRRGISGVDEFTHIFKAAGIAFVVLIGVTYFYRREVYSRLVLAYAWAITIVLASSARALLHRLQVVLRRRGVGVSRLALAGFTETSRLVMDQIRRHPGLGYRLIGVIDEDDQPKLGTWEQLRVLGGLKDLPRIVQNEHLDEVIFALPAGSHSRLAETLLNAPAAGAEFKIVSDLFGIITRPLQIDEIQGIPLYALKQPPLANPWARRAKRALDLLLVIPAILLLSPLLAAIALAVKLTSPGPVFYRQERVGRGNRTFSMIKFRSMRVDAEKHTGPVWAQKGDDRTTRVGAFLRKTSLDELPQLLNVLAGKMSLVGPRPERPHFVEQFKTDIPRYLERHHVKAGITGWAQIHGLRGNTPIAERTRYDLWYVENWSLGLDLHILLRTALDIFHHADAY